METLTVNAIKGQVLDREIRLVTTFWFLNIIYDPSHLKLHFMVIFSLYSEVVCILVVQWLVGSISLVKTYKVCFLFMLIVYGNYWLRKFLLNFKELQESFENNTFGRKYLI